MSFFLYCKGFLSYFIYGDNTKIYNLTLYFGFIIKEKFLVLVSSIGKISYS